MHLRPYWPASHETRRGRHDPLPYRNDQIIDAAMARALHADACRGHACVAWVVLWDLPAYPKRYPARLVTYTASPYLLLAETLAGIQEQFAARPGAVRATAWGSAGGGGDLVCGVGAGGSNQMGDIRR